MLNAGFLFRVWWRYLSERRFVRFYAAFESRIIYHHNTYKSSFSTYLERYIKRFSFQDIYLNFLEIFFCFFTVFRYKTIYDFTIAKLIFDASCRTQSVFISFIIITLLTSMFAGLPDGYELTETFDWRAVFMYLTEENIWKIFFI